MTQQMFMGGTPDVQRGSRWELKDGYTLDNFWSRVVVHSVGSFGAVALLPWTYDIDAYVAGPEVEAIRWMNGIALRHLYNEVA